MNFVKMDGALCTYEPLHFVKEEIICDEGHSFINLTKGTISSSAFEEYPFCHVEVVLSTPLLKRVSKSIIEHAVSVLMLKISYRRGACAVAGSWEALQKLKNYFDTLISSEDSVQEGVSKKVLNPKCDIIEKERTRGDGDKKRKRTDEELQVDFKKVKRQEDHRISGGPSFYKYSSDTSKDDDHIEIFLREVDHEEETYAEEDEHGQQSVTQTKDGQVEIPFTDQLDHEEETCTKEDVHTVEYAREKERHPREVPSFGQQTLVRKSGVTHRSPCRIPLENVEPNTKEFSSSSDSNPMENLDSCSSAILSMPDHLGEQLSTQHTIHNTVGGEPISITIHRIPLESSQQEDDGETPKDTEVAIDGEGKKEEKGRKNKPFVCDQCSFTCDARTKLDVHKKRHEKHKTLSCDVCSFRCIDNTTLSMHNVKHANKLIFCPQCAYRTLQRNTLRRHMLLKHSGREERTKEESKEKKVYKCDVCGYHTTMQGIFNRHQNKHKTRVYSCPECDYKSSRRQVWKRHIDQVHESMKQFVCEECGKSFKRKDSLTQHLRLHSGDIQCPKCSKHMKSQFALAEHMKSHSEERGFLCEECGASFKRKDVHRKHVQTIHRQPGVHRCEVCNKPFNAPFNLKRHMKLHTKASKAQKAMDDEKFSSVVLLKDGDVLTKAKVMIASDEGLREAMLNEEESLTGSHFLETAEGDTIFFLPSSLSSLNIQ